MPRKKNEIASVAGAAPAMSESPVSAAQAVKTATAKPTKKAAAKPRAKKAIAAPAAEPAAPKAAAHRHKKAVTTVNAVEPRAALVAPVKTALAAAAPAQLLATHAARAPELTPEQIYHEISALAYSYYEARGYQPGSPDEDWARAEREFGARFAR